MNLPYGTTDDVCYLIFKLTGRRRIGRVVLVDDDLNGVEGGLEQVGGTYPCRRYTRHYQ